MVLQGGNKVERSEGAKKKPNLKTIRNKNWWGQFSALPLDYQGTVLYGVFLMADAWQYFSMYF